MPTNPDPPATGTEAGANLLEQLPEGHVIHTLVSEHTLILGFLRQVDTLTVSLKECDTREAAEPILADLATAARNLLDAEKHHAREEEVLFPEMEQRGIAAPTAVMRQEHNFLLPLKQRLLDLAGGNAPTQRFIHLQQAISDTAERLVPNMVAHINKEDSVLYPMALQVITEPAIWDQMQKKCDEIGLCPFMG
jgi:hypothetical protein